MDLGTVLLIAFVLLFVVTLPRWQHSKNWGYGASGGFGVAAIVVLGLLIAGRL